MARAGRSQPSGLFSRCRCCLRAESASIFPLNQELHAIFLNVRFLRLPRRLDGERLQVLDNRGGPGKFLLHPLQPEPDGTNRDHGMSNGKVANIEGEYQWRQGSYVKVTGTTTLVMC